MELTVAITGASGSIYAHRTLIHLAASGAVERINLILSESALTVARVELGIDLRETDGKRVNQWLNLDSDSKIVRLHRMNNLASTPASGSTWNFRQIAQTLPSRRVRWPITLLPNAGP